MKKSYVLIDYENVKVRSLALLSEEHFHIRVFLGPNNTKIPVALVLSMQEMGERAEFVTLERVGRNALGFHIAYYLGSLAAVDAAATFHVISGDCSFDPLLRHLKTMNIVATRSESIERMPCFASPGAARTAAALAPAPKTAQQAAPESKNEAPREKAFADSGPIEGRPRIALPEAAKPAVFASKTAQQIAPESKQEASKGRAFADLLQRKA
jgi:hypothetical protein